MSYNTPQGRAYTLADLKRLVTYDSFGALAGAIQGLIKRSEQLERENKILKQNALDAESYKEQLLQLKKEVNNLKKG